ncbi:dihydrodipicolinate synthase/N-acetylneuraminate lyase [Pyrenochaeta sp. MPI-SDFR-AT-0127]|nr:dihydrodipicolinate synthase/N-acetylneuraminate lyase [Pyrenochaeta sp. MPI-SDFR-AT-0127]
MAPQELKGILVALVTPFTDDGLSVHEGKLEAHINRQIEAGVHGLVPGAGRVPVVAGIGALSTAEVVDMGNHAAKVGAAALMVVPPFYDPVNLEQVRELMNEVHETSQLPIVYYNIPSASGLKLSPSEMASLTEVGVQYVKDTSGDGPALTELLFELHERITTFNGWDTLTFYGLAAGAKGSVWGATNVIPELSIALYNAVVIEKDLEKGRKLWRKIYPVCKFLESHNYPSAVKTAMAQVGLDIGAPRKPFKKLRKEHADEITHILVAAGYQPGKSAWLVNGH